MSTDCALGRGATNLGTNGPPRCGMRGSLARMASTSEGVTVRNCMKLVYFHHSFPNTSTSLTRSTPDPSKYDDCHGFPRCHHHRSIVSHSEIPSKIDIPPPILAPMHHFNCNPQDATCRMASNSSESFLLLSALCQSLFSNHPMRITAPSRLSANDVTISTGSSCFRTSPFPYIL